MCLNWTKGFPPEQTNLRRFITSSQLLLPLSSSAFLPFLIYFSPLTPFPLIQYFFFLSLQAFTFLDDVQRDFFILSIDFFIFHILIYFPKHPSCPGDLFFFVLFSLQSFCPLYLFFDCLHMFPFFNFSSFVTLIVSPSLFFLFALISLLPFASSLSLVHFIFSLSFPFVFFPLPFHPSLVSISVIFSFFLFSRLFSVSFFSLHFFTSPSNIYFPHH